MRRLQIGANAAATAFTPGPMSGEVPHMQRGTSDNNGHDPFEWAARPRHARHPMVSPPGDCSARNGPW